MKEFRITGQKSLDLCERTLDFTSETQVKIKITKALVDNDSIKQYLTGEPHGIVPITSASAVISEPQQNEQFGRGERVYVDPYNSCKECYGCKTNHSELCIDLATDGITTDGFLTEFKIVSRDSIKLLPDSVSDENALFIDKISKAINIIDKLGASKGEYIVICGSDYLSNILCQISLYYQVIPILVDNNEINIDIAKKYGVYYTCPADSSAVAFIKQITGGRMAENVVALSSSALPSKYVADCCSMGANVVFSGDSTGNFISYNAALKKQLNIGFINSGYANITSAINILVNKAVHTDFFIRDKVAFADAEKAFMRQESEEKNAAAISGIAIDI